MCLKWKILDIFWTVKHKIRDNKHQPIYVKTRNAKNETALNLLLIRMMRGNHTLYPPKNETIKKKHCFFVILVINSSPQDERIFLISKLSWRINQILTWIVFLNLFRNLLFLKLPFDVFQKMISFVKIILFSLLVVLSISALLLSYLEKYIRTNEQIDK